MRGPLLQFFLTPDVIFVVYDHFMCKVFLEGRRVEELRQKVAAEAGIFLINFDVHVLPALYKYKALVKVL